MLVCEKSVSVSVSQQQHQPAASDTIKSKICFYSLVSGKVKTHSYNATKNVCKTNACMYVYMHVRVCVYAIDTYICHIIHIIHRNSLDDLAKVSCILNPEQHLLLKILLNTYTQTHTHIFLTISHICIIISYTNP